MSLKTFHIVFITVSTILSVGVGIWAISGYRSRGDMTSLVVGVVALVAAVALVWYGWWFLKKLKGVSYL